MKYIIGNCGSKSVRRAVTVKCFESKLNYSTKDPKTASDDNYQFLHKSQLPTLYFQKSLPRLPIPELQKTCQRYLAAVVPILTPDNLSRTKSIVSEFSAGAGQKLHELLQQTDASNKNTSYISQPWFDMYLSDRSPLPLNYNPLLVMKPDIKSDYNKQLIRSANLVISSLRFWRALKANILEPEVYHMNPAKSNSDLFRKVVKMAPTLYATYVAYAFKAFPLDMSQYDRLFGVTRIPKITKDILYQADERDSRHIVVMRGGKYYAVNVLNDDGEIIASNKILGRLKAIIDENPTGEVLDGQSLSLMTATNRDEWAKTRQHLLDIGNSKELAIIDSALFCLSLDSNQVEYDETRPQHLIKHLLAGDGINRWFDKSITLIVGGDGTAAVNFEHSWGDGVAVLRYFNEIYKDSTENPCLHPNSLPYMPNKGDNSIQSIDFKLDSRIQNDILKASQLHNQTVAGLDVNILRYTGGINKKTCKNSKVSPDAIMQLAFQLAYRQAFGDYVGSYESCSTAAFRHGRTETIRPCTIATKAFCESVLESDSQKEILLQMLQNCSNVHGQLTKEAAMGQGFDRHLFGMRHMAELNGIEIPELYNDEAFKKINHTIISTSTLASQSVLAGSFGPVVPNGLGIGYSILDEECGAVVTSYNGKRDGRAFVDSLNEAFNKIHEIFHK